jgi:hypothetical protein
MTPEEQVLRCEAIIDMMKQRRRRIKMLAGMDKELNQLRNEAEIKGHTGFCMGDYKFDICFDCASEFKCLKLFIREKADVEARTIAKMKEIQDDKENKFKRA